MRCPFCGGSTFHPLGQGIEQCSGMHREGRVYRVRSSLLANNSFYADAFMVHLSRVRDPSVWERGKQHLESQNLWRIVQPFIYACSASAVFA